MANTNAGRRGARWRKAQARIYTTQTHCWLCQQPVNQALPSRHKMSKTVDHKQPLSLGGDPYELSNLGLAHRWCNESRGNKPPKTPNSRQW